MKKLLVRTVDVLMILLAGAILAVSAYGSWIIVTELGAAITQGSK